MRIESVELNYGDPLLVGDLIGRCGGVGRFLNESHFMMSWYVRRTLE